MRAWLAVVRAIARNRPVHLGRDQAAGIQEGGPTGEQILNLKRPVEAMDITAGIVAHKKNPSCAACAMSVEPPAKSQSCT